MRKVEVASYTEEWAGIFASEAEKLRSTFGEELVEVHHIGSTSVHGLKAKPIIDIMIIVKEISRVDYYNKDLQFLGYEPMGENGITGRRFFQKGGNNRSHHIHIFQIGSPEITRHLAFRDYLRAHPKVRNKYGALKEQLANRFPWDIEAYINGKNELVREIEQKAVKWYRLNCGEITQS
ncbi:GrpB family protein [Oceanobacillus piezotolerans]|uniref:GrpB family protein n=1 Tax=Oceanobacillus piezotolerans TaxID=2448030 RepID=A0A498DBA8_9BACI|nr:GrpB family protein [Oceanobacillus piezotolerans]RLL48291.1 GrpB family protein [Oceanobacillus piezotolerans]